MTEHGAVSALIEQLLPATPEEVYDEWIDPDALLEWMCPRPARCLKVEADPRGARTPDLVEQHLRGWRLIAAQLESTLKTRRQNQQ